MNQTSLLNDKTSAGTTIEVKLYTAAGEDYPQRITLT
jgi:hypothetical protein